MRHKYPTRAIVLSRAPIAEESALLTLLTRDVGLVRARAQGVRKSGAKLASALATLAESDSVLVEGKDGWRVSGAVLETDWFPKLSRSARERAGRVASLILRLVSGEAPDPAVFDAYRGSLAALASFPEERHDAIECLAALQVLAALGLDAGGAPDSFTNEALDTVAAHRTEYVKRVNRGITASGL